MTNSLTGVEAGIEHGTDRGYRQHKRRHVTMCTPCMEAGVEAKRAQQAWNRGKTGEPLAIVAAPVVAVCTTELCGQAVPDAAHVGGMWQAAVVEGQRRAYCSPWCATYAQALADVRSLRGAGVAA